MKRVLITISLLAACTALSAQNLNPVVEVTNVYAREATGIEKPNQLLAVPDSVYKFDLDFDYSVKSTPYKGAYEFNPYLVQLRPSARLSGEQTLYLKAGAGFRLHPEVDFVWNPLRTKNFRLDVYANHNSYIGHYRNITVQDNVVDWDGTMREKSGIRSNTVAGTDLWAAFKGGEFTANLQYKNVFATDFYGYGGPGSYSHHKGQLEMRIQNKPAAKFLYNVGTRLATLGYASIREFHTVSDATLGFRMGRNNSLRVTAGLETVGFEEGQNGLKLEVTPHYQFAGKRFNLDLGIKYSYIGSTAGVYEYKGGILFPDVNFSFRIADAAVVFASATGGDSLNGYDTLLEDNPYLGGFAWHRDVTVTRINVFGGIRGSVAGKFSYDLRGGWKWLDNACGWSFVELEPIYYSSAYPVSDSVEPTLLPTMAYVSPLRTIYGQLTLSWVSSSWDIMARGYYGHTPKPNKETPAELNVFGPPSYTAAGHIFYKWANRIKVGATIDVRGKLNARRPVPGYQDLGIQADYAFSRHMAAWLKLGNLLNQTIQRTPFYAEAGIYGSVGVKLTF